MQTQEVKQVLAELKRGGIFLQLGDWVEVREDGNGPNIAMKFSGPCNGTVERAEACPIVHSRDYGALAVFFTSLAKRDGTLGDMGLTIREILTAPDPEAVKKLKEEQDRKADDGPITLPLDDADIVVKDFEV